MKTMKKFFASLLVLCMVLAMPNMAALADDATPITLGENVTTSIEEGVSDPTVYSYTVPSNFEGVGAFTLTVSEANAYYRIAVTNTTRESLDNANAQKNDWYDTPSATVYALAGDVIKVEVYASSEYVLLDEATEEWGFVYPAVDVTWSADCKAVGTVESPENIATMDNRGSYSYYTTVPVAVGNDGYNYTYTAEMDGTLVIWFDYGYDDWETEENEPEVLEAALKADATITNGSKTVKLSTDCVEKDNYGTILKTVQMDVKVGDEITIKISSAATDRDVAMMSWNAEVLEPAGAESNPYSIPDGETSHVIEVAAGQTFYIQMGESYKGYNLTVTAEGKEFSVLGSNGDVSAENGTVTISLAAGWAGIQTAITNAEETAVTYTLTFEAPLGTEGNPDEIIFAEGETSGKDSHEFTYVDTSYGAPTGFDYFFKWVATGDGYVRITLSATYEGDAREYYVFEDGSTTPTPVTVEGDVWYYYASNTAEDGDVIYSFSKETEDGAKVSNGQLLYVEKGDVVLVRLMALDATTGLFVDSTVEVELEYVDLATGSEESAIKDIENHLPDTDDEGNPVETPATVILLDKDGNISGVITKEVLEAAKENGVDIAFGVAEGVVWVIDADSLGDTLTDLDLSVGGEVAIPEDMVSAIVGENDGYTISIAHDGALGLDAILGLILGDENCDYTGMYANLFWYNETTGGLEFQDAYEMEDGHTAVFEMTHASDYVIVMTEEAMSAEDNIVPETPGDDDTIEGTGDFSSTMIYVIVLLGAALVSAGFVAKKRFA